MPLGKWYWPMCVGYVNGVCQKSTWAPQTVPISPPDKPAGPCETPSTTDFPVVRGHPMGKVTGFSGVPSHYCRGWPEHFRLTGCSRPMVRHCSHGWCGETVSAPGLKVPPTRGRGPGGSTGWPWWDPCRPRWCPGWPPRSHRHSLHRPHRRSQRPGCPGAPPRHR